MVLTWLEMTVKDHTVVQEVLGLNMGRLLVVLYTDNGMIGVWDS